MKNRVMLIPLVIVLLVTSPFSRAEIQLRPFNIDSYKTILEQHQSEIFLMVLWSVDCPPCIDELATLGKFHRSHPEKNIVMVSTDSRHQARTVKDLIYKNGLTNIQQWIFSADSMQSIRFAIDPLWYGELPRSYFHNGKNKRKARSGRLEEDVLLTLFKATANTDAGL